MRKDYRILSLRKEYPGYTGKEKWLIITDLSEKEFALLHPSQYLLWEEAVILSSEAGKVLRIFQDNENRYSRRRKKEMKWKDDHSYRIREEILLFEETFK